MKAYATPNVYVEEIALLPPTVAQSETAVPVFIGYTELIPNKEAKDAKNMVLPNTPVRITSLVEYESIFGKEWKGDFKDKKTDIVPTYLLYYQLQMFFNNGGGVCYVISVGVYAEDGKIEHSPFESALEKLNEEDEPTLILLTDAVNLSEPGKYHEVCKKALDLCGKKQNLFAILDVKNGMSYESDDGINTIELFRTEIGQSNLKYGAAYFPYLKTTIPFPVHVLELKKRHTLSLGRLEFGYVGKECPLLKIKTVETVTKEVEDAKAEADKAEAATKEAENAKKKADENLMAATKEAENAKKKADENLVAATKEVEDAKKEADAKDKVATQEAEKAKTDSNGNIEANRNAKKAKEEADKAMKIANRNVQKVTIETENAKKEANQKLENARKDAVEKSDRLTNLKLKLTSTQTELDSANELNKLADTLDPNCVGLAIRAETITLICSDINKITIDLIYDAWEKLEENEKARFTCEKLPVSDVPQSQDMRLVRHFCTDEHAYNIQKEASSKLKIILPPSGVMAGVYARVDNDRGIWKAPANVSINGVIAPIIKITDDVQKDLNVDTKAGKSINVIRNFVGMGNLVWGSRTLAGQDNEWKYIPVRRLFNMIEEALKRSTRFAIFEPNHEMTWLKVKVMTDNYLNDLWKKGALAGSKPEEAYFVHVGSTTMTSQDILEGRMIVKVGIAAVRPAEFVILQFSHLLQTM